MICTLSDVGGRQVLCNVGGRQVLLGLGGDRLQVLVAAGGVHHLPLFQAVGGLENISSYSFCGLVRFLGSNLNLYNKIQIDESVFYGLTLFR